MADDKNIELNDEMLENVAGGNMLERLRTEPGTIIGTYDEAQRKFIVKRDQGSQVHAFCHMTGRLLSPGTRVTIALVGLNKWEIVSFT